MEKIKRRSRRVVVLFFVTALALLPVSAGAAPALDPGGDGIFDVWTQFDSDDDDDEQEGFTGRDEGDVDGDGDQGDGDQGDGDQGDGDEGDGDEGDGDEGEGDDGDGDDGDGDQGEGDQGDGDEGNDDQGDEGDDDQGDDGNSGNGDPGTTYPGGDNGGGDTHDTGRSSKPGVVVIVPFVTPPAIGTPSGGSSNGPTGGFGSIDTALLPPNVGAAVALFDKGWFEETGTDLVHFIAGAVSQTSRGDLVSMLPPALANIVLAPIVTLRALLEVLAATIEALLIPSVAGAIILFGSSRRRHRLLLEALDS